MAAPIAERGTALVEACVALIVAIPLFSGAGILAYFCFARALVEHAAYEAAVCAASGEAGGRCESRLAGSLRGALPIGDVRRASVLSGPRAAEAVAAFDVAPGLTTRVRVRVALPLRASTRPLVVSWPGGAP